MKEEKHINFVTSFLKNLNTNTILINTKYNPITNVGFFENIKTHSEMNKDLRVVVSSEIFKYKLDQAPIFFSKLRDAIGERAIIFFHPSKIHNTDRDSILGAVKQPFKVMQGHDLETDNKSELEIIFVD